MDEQFANQGGAVNATESARRSPLYPVPEGATRPLRVVLVAPDRIPAWMSRFLELASEYPWIEVIVVAEQGMQVPRVDHVPVLVRVAVALESKLLGRNPCLERVALPSSGPGNINHVQDPLPIAQRVIALHPDLVLLLGPYGWAEMLAGSAVHGCWQVDATLVDERHAGVSLLSPMVRSDATTTVGIRLVQGDGPAVELGTSTGQTRAGSFLRQREAAFRKLPGLLLRALHRLAAGEAFTAPRSASVLHLAPLPPLGSLPGARAVLLLARAAVRRTMGRRRDGSIGWTLVLRLAGSPLDPEDPVIGSHALLRPQTGWWADPFVVNAKQRKLIFVEEMDNPKRNNANIACVELVEGGARRLGIALDEPGHLSYPQVFQWQGHWYMTVETGYDRRVSLYKAIRFPLDWVRIKDLITGRVCVDPTLHHQDDHWYLFTSVSENGTSTSDELFLFVADRLEGPYLPHPASPLVCDVRRARMAGKLFWHQGRLIRPAQDCGPCYGSAVVFNEVLELGPTRYRERPLSKLTPFFARRVAGCHTYNADGQIELLDLFGRPPGGTAYLSVTDLAPASDFKEWSPTASPTSMVPATPSLTSELGVADVGRSKHGCKQGAVQGPRA